MWMLFPGSLGHRYYSQIHIGTGNLLTLESLHFIDKMLPGPGALLGPYQIAASIGNAGTGEVYRRVLAIAFIVFAFTSSVAAQQTSLNRWTPVRASVKAEIIDGANESLSEVMLPNAINDHSRDQRARPVLDVGHPFRHRATLLC